MDPIIRKEAKPSKCCTTSTFRWALFAIILITVCLVVAGVIGYIFFILPGLNSDSDSDSNSNFPKNDTGLENVTGFKKASMIPKNLIKIKHAPEVKESYAFHLSRNSFSPFSKVNFTCSINGTQEKCPEKIQNFSDVEERDKNSSELYFSKNVITIRNSTVETVLRWKFLSPEKGSLFTRRQKEEFVYREEDFDVDWTSELAESGRLSFYSKKNLDYFSCLNCSKVENRLRFIVVGVRKGYKAIFGGNANGTVTSGLQRDWTVVEIFQRIDTEGQDPWDLIRIFNNEEIQVCRCVATNKDLVGKEKLKFCLDNMNIREDSKAVMKLERCRSFKD